MWHASQEIVPLKPDGSVNEFQARLSGLEEITRRVLNWGSKVQVRGPPALLKQELQAMVKAVAMAGPSRAGEGPADEGGAGAELIIAHI